MIPRPDDAETFPTDKSEIWRLTVSAPNSTASFGVNLAFAGAARDRWADPFKEARLAGIQSPRAGPPGFPDRNRTQRLWFRVGLGRRGLRSCLRTCLGVEGPGPGANSGGVIRTRPVSKGLRGVGWLCVGNLVVRFGDHWGRHRCPGRRRVGRFGLQPDQNQGFDPRALSIHGEAIIETGLAEDLRDQQDLIFPLHGERELARGHDPRWIQNLETGFSREAFEDGRPWGASSFEVQAARGDTRLDLDPGGTRGADQQQNCRAHERPPFFGSDRALVRPSIKPVRLDPGGVQAQTKL
jgi:hypothetical protein